MHKNSLLTPLALSWNDTHHCLRSSEGTLTLQSLEIQVEMQLIEPEFAISAPDGCILPFGLNLKQDGSSHSSRSEHLSGPTIIYKLPKQPVKQCMDTGAHFGGGRQMLTLIRWQTVHSPKQQPS